jgi:hypothetical protein
VAKNRNSITGDKIITKHKSKSFDDNFDLIFRSKKPVIEQDDDDWINTDEDLTEWLTIKGIQENES